MIQFILIGIFTFITIIPCCNLHITCCNSYITDAAYIDTLDERNTMIKQYVLNIENSPSIIKSRRLNAVDYFTSESEHVITINPDSPRSVFAIDVDISTNVDINYLTDLYLHN